MKLKTDFLSSLFIFPMLILSACHQQEAPLDSSISYALDALSVLNLNKENISLPKVPYPISTAARLDLVDRALSEPLGLIQTANTIKTADSNASMSKYLNTIFNQLDIGKVAISLDNSSHSDFGLITPAEWKDNDATQYTSIRLLLESISRANNQWNQIFSDIKPDSLITIQQYLKKSNIYRGANSSAHDLPQTCHQLGDNINLASLASTLVTLFSQIENFLSNPSGFPDTATRDWQTPLGIIRIAGTENNTHEGDFLMILDRGGDDTYINVSRPLATGNSLVVLDLAGNDTVTWDVASGPGSGILGLGIWIDQNGNDVYQGSNYGLGSALLGAGIFLDENGNDTYISGVFSEGAGQYGLGIFLDIQGDDQYIADMSGQGFAGPGGIGLLSDFRGHDTYNCGNRYSDQVKNRVARHGSKHFLSMCQGYSFGLRPEISGGIGLLIDHKGNDTYTADLFAQGGAYWFGLGMLLEFDGNDIYSAFEHAQGESLHLGAGFLGDWAGNDQYTSYEHSQGVGIDRAVGLLYELTGDDRYVAHHESQGSGIKPYGVGILLEQNGNDTYEAIRDAQGFALPDPTAPEDQWPIGMIIDQGGNDIFKLPYTDPVNNQGRIQNRQGIAIDHDSEVKK